MQCLIEIGNVTFQCDDMATAAKVADLLGTMRPVANKFWRAGQCGQPGYDNGYVVCFTGGKDHKVVISQKAKASILANEEEVAEFERQMQEIAEAKAQEAQPA